MRQENGYLIRGASRRCTRMIAILLQLLGTFPRRPSASSRLRCSKKVLVSIRVRTVLLSRFSDPVFEDWELLLSRSEGSGFDVPESTGFNTPR